MLICSFGLQSQQSYVIHTRLYIHVQSRIIFSFSSTGFLFWGCFCFIYGWTSNQETLVTSDMLIASLKTQGITFVISCHGIVAI